MSVIHLTRAEFLKKVGDYTAIGENWKFLGDKPAIIDFYASWCGPCRALAPVLDELALEYVTKVDIYKVDIERERELAAAFGIRSVPTIFFIPLEGQPRRIKGAIAKELFKSKIEELLMAAATI